MKVFLSALENPETELILERDSLLWNLMSYYYARNQKAKAVKIRDKSELVLIDSGAHSFQKGTKVDWDKYTKEYARFIQDFDRPNVLGYFEMDVDNILGYEKVLELRAQLEAVSDKIIPVWHKNRGIADFKKMCHDYAGRIVAITGFKNADIKDEQYLMFLKYAHQCGCKVHCLGMTRKKILDKVPFDFTDSASWRLSALYGRCRDRSVSKEFSKTNRSKVFLANYLEAMKIQRHYQNYWRKYTDE